MLFSTSTIRRARRRQYGRCGLCGRNLNDLMDFAHNLQPDSMGGLDHPDNCVLVCNECKFVIKNHGKFKSCLIAPRTYFRYFKGRAK